MRGLWVQGRASFPQEGRAGGDDVRGDRVPLQKIDVNEDVTLGQYSFRSWNGTGTGTGTGIVIKSVYYAVLLRL